MVLAGPEPAGLSERRRWDVDATRLVLCGLAVLFWELVLIRWLGATIRVVAYFSNLVLISAFFGLGVGALLARFGARLERLIAPLAGVAVLLGVWLGGLWHPNPGSALEYIWIGAPPGIEGTEARRVVPVAVVLVLVYGVTAALFAAFGQYMGRLFRRHRPLRAYSLEVAGSLAGIALFALLAWLQTGPFVWFAVGALLLLGMLPWRLTDALVTLLVAGVALASATLESRGHTWSPYYRISVDSLTRIKEHSTNRTIDFGQPIGEVLTVNNDYHQMMLDLSGAAPQHDYVADWRRLYESPYVSLQELPPLPPGPILIVGAGTGNDVAAALRATDRAVTAVEIDPSIAAIGRERHPERPYSDPRVRLVIDDARSFFHRAQSGAYAAVVFGFLDSHRLLSAFGSVRLDNFVYTREAMAEARRLLVPGGRLALTFAANRPWIHARLVRLVGQEFGGRVWTVHPLVGYANGILYLAARDADGPATVADTSSSLPTDDWPFLYLQTRSIPAHNLLFLAVALALSAGAFLVLPKGERRLRVPYFLLGAAFFLLETSNVVRMALLFGSTWSVNAVVFAGILVLVLLANLTASRWKVPVSACTAAVGLGILLAATLPTGLLLELPAWARAAAAVVVYLGPVFFGGLIFARLIEHEPRLYEAYGSNVLGAVVGGCAEYLSLLFGFRFLLALALAFYFGVYLLLRGRSRLAPTA